MTAPDTTPTPPADERIKMQAAVVRAARDLLATWDEPIRVERWPADARDAQAAFTTIQAKIEALRAASEALTAWKRRPASPSPRAASGDRHRDDGQGFRFAGKDGE
jgi:hypothetical protein